MHMPDAKRGTSCTPRFKENDVVFIIDGIVPYQISRMAEIRQIIDNTAILKCVPGNGIIMRRLNDLFASKYDAENAIKDRINAVRKRYTAEIKDIDSLVRFMLTHDINPGAEDYIAREVVIQRADELGIDLRHIKN